MSNVILRVIAYIAVSLFATTSVACLASDLSVTLQNQAEAPARDARKMKSVVYTNEKYGFRFSLPASWKGYSISVSEWQGGDGRSYLAGEPMPPPEEGPLLSIGHPLSTESDPHQDIPIMIFTKAQWRLVQANKLIVSAAPIGPSELGRNAEYVFAVPPRFNYALLTGWEEVGEIIQHHPLQPF
jgi:hypothetical protein